MSEDRTPEAENTSVNASATASKDQVLQVLTKVLPNGQLARIPRHPQHCDIVLGLLCLDLQRRYPYPEIELNEVLRLSLQKLDALVDHVTCRRYMVDLGFLKRDRAGTRYFLNYPRLIDTLSIEVMKQAEALIRSARDAALARRLRNSQRSS